MGEKWEGCTDFNYSNEYAIELCMHVWMHSNSTCVNMHRCGNTNTHTIWITNTRVLFGFNIPCARAFIDDIARIGVIFSFVCITLACICGPPMELSRAAHFDYTHID